MMKKKFKLSLFFLSSLFLLVGCFLFGFVLIFDDNIVVIIGGIILEV